MNEDQKYPPGRSPVPRRDFIKATGSASLAAVSWWGITAKSDAMQANSQQVKTGDASDSMTHNYDYDGGQ
ncbi:hypothetical protein [Planctomycetes bacterium K23_9]|uniref:Uncharacterized protein n=1 Tax=Stieleria marina TaxID=1930275 RepID=A0A517NZK6_9BACT|nr:hypothetical protein K239x_45690 [Planctomycetes bacterium K23_9]